MSDISLTQPYSEKEKPAMPDLFRLVNDSHAEPVEEEPFVNEAELERFVFDNPQLLGEGIEPVRRQVRCDAGIMDIFAIDTSGEPGRCVIVELKNVPADSNVLLQTLRYASWVVENEDSVRLMLQQEGHSEADIEFDSILIVVAAPEIRSALVDLSGYVVDAFEFDFVEVRRFKGQEGSSVTIDRPQSSSLSAKGIPHDPQEWTWDEYQTHNAHKKWSDEQIELGRALFNGIQEKSKSNGWSLKDVFVKSYIVFKMGGKSVVGLERRWAKGVAVWFALPQQPEETRISDLKDIAESSKTFWRLPEKYFYVNVGDPDFNLDLFNDLFETAYGKAADAS